MKSFFQILFFAFGLLIQTAPTVQASLSNPEVIIAGDSWAYLPCFFKSSQQAFLSRKLSVDIHDCLKTSQVGLRADNFKTKAPYQEMMKRLRENSHARVVYLSLGGNDMLAYWSTVMTAAEEHSLFQGILNHIQEIVTDIHSVRPDVWVLVSGYDFGYLYPNNPISAYRNIFEHMGSPTPAEVNSAFLRLVEYLTQLKGDHVSYQHHFGLMHYYYGVPEAPLPAFQTAAPDLISPPSDPAREGGFPTARNNRFAQMHLLNLYFDPHHIRPQGYVYVFEHSIDQYIGKWIKDDFIAPEINPALLNRTEEEIPSDVQVEAARQLEAGFSELLSQ